MRQLLKLYDVVLVAALLFITGCGRAAPVPTATPVPSETPPARPSVTPSATPTRQTSPTPPATATATTQPTAAALLASNFALGERMRSLVGGFSVRSVPAYDASQVGSSVSLGDNERGDTEEPFVRLTLTAFRRATLEENGYDPQWTPAETVNALHVNLFVNSGLWSVWEHLETSEPYSATIAGRDAWVIDTHTTAPMPESQKHVNAQTVLLLLDDEWLMEGVLYLTWPAAIGDEQAKFARDAWAAVLGSLEFFPPVPLVTCTVSTDETYGYTPGFPIRLPASNDNFSWEATEEPTDPIADYFAAVRGPAGEVLAYQPAGAIVLRTEVVEYPEDVDLEPYQVDVTVDAYEVTQAGGHTVTLYFDHRSPDARQAPVGFTCGRDFATPTP